jgi:hypothetical protein
MIDDTLQARNRMVAHSSVLTMRLKVVCRMRRSRLCGVGVATHDYAGGAIDQIIALFGAQASW